jgi:hypothetical protein
MDLTGIQNQEFIDFSFDERSITEFGLAGILNGSRLPFIITPQFTNIATQIAGKNESEYWGSTIKEQTFQIKIGTDGMTGLQLSDFIQHFSVGKVGKLTFYETDYKYYYVVLANKIQGTFTPFDTETTIGARTFDEVKYAGDMTLNFIAYDPKAYTDYSYFADDNVLADRSWFLQSRIPLLTWLPANVFIPEGNFVSQVKNLDPVNTTSFIMYNAGTNIAKANLQFTLTPSFTDHVLTWTDYTITNDKNSKEIILSQPRIFTDADYALDILGNYTDVTWDANKDAVMDDLRENLDSEVKESILLIVNATVTGDFSYDDKLDSIEALVTTTWTILLDSNNIECTMEGTTPRIADDIDTEIVAATAVSALISDVHNGEFLLLDTGLGYYDNSGYELDTQEFTCDRTLNALEITYQYSYI